MIISADHITLTSQHFRTIAQPLLFEHLVYHPYAVPWISESVQLVEKDTVDHALARFRFWRQRRIAPGVKSCRVSPWDQRWDDDGTMSHALPYLLRDEFMAGLHTFAGLRRLVLVQFHIPHAAMVEFARLQSLQSLEIEYCSVHNFRGETISGSKSTLTNFKIVDDLHNRSALTPWLELLDASRIYSLYLAYDLAEWGTKSDLDRLPRFPALRRLTLEIVRDSLLFTSGFDFLVSHCPALDALVIDGDYRNKFIHEPMGLPDASGVTVRSLKLHATLIPFFCPMVSVTEVSLWLGIAQSLIASVRGLNLSGIESLSISLDYTSERRLDPQEMIGDVNCVLDWFPRLQKFEVQFVVDVDSQWARHHDYGSFEETNSAHGPTEFFLSLSKISFSSTLRALAIHWRIDINAWSSSYPEYTAAALDPYVLQEKLVEKCPQLEKMWLDAWVYLIDWRRETGSARLQTLRSTKILYAVSMFVPDVDLVATAPSRRASVELVNEDEGWRNFGRRQSAKVQQKQ
ncbi:F-box domain-containing protein [Mycena chlorophos]|uniref:F-box domain-containing protein n=1 Tax=Mycena chlorophos TaxID=658473 RepID=A0A8H6TNL9_MYCCL|nr:F-box domain-containing protein [Mycena chlorophos]